MVVCLQRACMLLLPTSAIQARCMHNVTCAADIRTATASCPSEWDYRARARISITNSWWEESWDPSGSSCSTAPLRLLTNPRMRREDWRSVLWAETGPRIDTNNKWSFRVRLVPSLELSSSQDATLISRYIVLPGIFQVPGRAHAII